MRRTSARAVASRSALGAARVAAPALFLLAPFVTMVACANTPHVAVAARELGARLPEPPDPPARTEWHAEPVLEKLWSANVTLYDHADASLALEPALAMLQAQYDWLAQYTSSAPGRVIVHVGSRYPCGFSMSGADDGAPEMFLQAGSIFDSQANYAHEMTHAFAFHWGALPHWFGESIADVAYADAEIALWKRRKEAPFLATFDRIDHRSYELMRLRARYGASYFPRVFRLLEARQAERVIALAPEASLETKNHFLIALLSEAAGEDLLPLFAREFGFDVRTRERQRGY